jgi:hypothetical protein
MAFQPHALHVTNATRLKCAADESVMVAMCVYGTARAFSRPAMYRAIRLHAMDSVGTTETFLRIRLSEASRGKHGYAEVASMADVATAAAAIGAVSLHIDSDDPPHSEADSTCFCANSSYHQGFLNRMEGLQWCAAQIQGREERIGQRYEAVIAARADLYYAKPMPPVSCFAALCIGAASRTGLCDRGPRIYKDRDHLWIIPRELLQRTLVLLPSPKSLCQSRHTNCLRHGYAERLLDEAFQLGALGCVHTAFDDALLAQPNMNASGDASNSFAAALKGRAVWLPKTRLARCSAYTGKYAHYWRDVLLHDRAL